MAVGLKWLQKFLNFWFHFGSIGSILVPLWFHWFHFGIQYKNATVEAFSGGGKIMNENPKICAIATKLCDISNLRGYTYI